MILHLTLSTTKKNTKSRQFSHTKEQISGAVILYLGKDTPLPATNGFLCYELGWFERHELKRERSVVMSEFYSQKREVQAIDEDYLKIGSKVQTIDEECSKIEVGSDS
jgi:hypothetical protein